MPATTLDIVMVEKCVELCYIGLLAYVAHLTFLFLRHRLDVLGKDAVLFYRRSQWNDGTPKDDRL